MIKKGNEMIYLFLNNGGLGNQLYQYAMARSLQEIYGDKIRCDISKFDYKGTNVVKRPLVLNEFQITDRIEFGRYTIPRLVYKVKKKFYEKIFFWTDESVRYKKMSDKGIFAPSGGYFSYFEASLTSQRTKYINGLFQAHEYFDDIRPILQRELIQKYEFLSKETRKVIEKMRNENSVCVHWRRGDYLSPQYAKCLLVCDENYYKKAINKIASKIDNPVFYIFTNSPEDAVTIQENNIFDFPMHYVNLMFDGEHSDTEDFSLMLACKHYIISNSTFSWWAQYLNDDSEKMVCAPSVWNRNEEAKTLYFPEWEIIEV